MSKTKTVNVILSDEERLLISRAMELSSRSENTAVASSFLTPREQRILFESMDALSRSRLFMWGGYKGSVRRRAVFLPSWLVSGEACPHPLFSEEREAHFLSVLSEMGMTDITDEFISAVKLEGSGYEKLTHRDFMGALMALGLKRSVIGDIVVKESCAYCFCEEVSARYIITELDSVGRDKIRSEAVAVGPDFSAEPKFQSISTTVAAPRLDGVVKALCAVSREEAQRLVSSGCCEVNYYTAKESDLRIGAGDILAVRGFGKYIIDRAEDETRRQRIRVNARKYL